MFDQVETNASAAIPLSAAAAIGQIGGWRDETAQRRKTLISAVSRTATLMALPIDSAQLSPAALRATILNRPASAFDLEPRSLITLISGLRAVLRRLDIIDRADWPLSPAWNDLLKLLTPKKRAGLISFARYCSGFGVAPSAVDDDRLELFKDWLDRRTLTPRPGKRAGEVRGAWNKASKDQPGWPQQRLSVLRNSAQHVLPLDAFPPSFRTDLVAFGDRLGATSLDLPFEDIEFEDDDFQYSGPTKPCRPITVELRKSHARWAASALHATGIPLAEITSLTSLVTPTSRVHSVLKFLFEHAGRKPSARAGHVADVLHMIGRYQAKLPEADVKRIAKWAKPVRLTYTGMTEKNERLVRQMLEPAKELKYLELPDGLMKAARKLRQSQPMKAAGLAMRAAAIQFLSRCPVRLENLTGTTLAGNIQRSDPPHGRITHIRYAPHLTKNGQTILLPVSNKTAEVLQEWINVFRPLIASSGCRYLFPGYGTGDRPITHQGMRAAIKETMTLHVGVELTPHRFRHLAARYFLRDFPGHYAEVQLLLGHKDIKSTMRYAGIESEAAAIRLDQVLERRMHDGARCRPVSHVGHTKRKSNRKVG